ASRSAIFRLTVGNGMPSLRPAAEKLPVSTEATSKDIASRRSTELWPWVSNIERTLFEDCRIIFKIDRADVQHRGGPPTWNRAARIPWSLTLEPRRRSSIEIRGPLRVLVVSKRFARRGLNCARR